MKTINWKDFLLNGLNLSAINPKSGFTSMTVGIFDGVHMGHQALIERIVSHNKDYTPAVVTFRENHKTGKVMRNKENNTYRDIQNFQQKLEILENSGIQITIVIDFTDEIRNMPGIEFLEILLKNGNIGFFAAGSGFRCGSRLDTDAIAIEKFFASRGIPAEIVTEVMEGALPVSSSRIRAAIAEGDHALAEKMLGRKI